MLSVLKLEDAVSTLKRMTDIFQSSLFIDYTSSGFKAYSRREYMKGLIVDQLEIIDKQYVEVKKDLEKEFKKDPYGNEPTEGK